MMQCPICGGDGVMFVDESGSRGFHFRHSASCILTDQPPPSQVILQDCIEGMRALPDECVDLIVSDPPYLINYESNHRKDKTHDFCSPIQNDDNPDLITDYMKECYRILKQDKACYVFCSSKTLDFFKNAAQDARFRLKNTIIWVKNNWTAGDLKAQFGQQYEPCLLLNKGRAEINGKRLTDVWTFDRVSGPKQVHQNQKPVPLIAQCIEKHSQPGDIVFDGFMGSGTTAVAARQMGRRFLGFEIEPKYFDIITNRLKEGVQLQW